MMCNYIERFEAFYEISSFSNLDQIIKKRKICFEGRIILFKLTNFGEILIILCKHVHRKKINILDKFNIIIISTETIRQ